MSEREPSKTALAVAILRAVHQMLDASPKILDDPVSAQLLMPGLLREVRAHLDPYRAPRALALRAHVLLRSRYAEDRLAQAVARGVRQYLLLGAGLDTFAYRQPAWASRLRIFEADQPASQRDKRQRLESAHITPPANVEFVPLDFETTSLAAGLRASRFDPGQPTFIAWLGVMVYLTPAAAEAVFQFAASLPRGSEIVFTFSQPADTFNPARSNPGLAERAAQLGEPWITRVTPAALTAQLRGLGFSAVSLPTPAELTERYLQGRTDGLAAGRRQNIASAVV
jgi:methyltransferase (TIGR00027 family)